MTKGEVLLLTRDELKRLAGGDLVANGDGTGWTDTGTSCVPWTDGSGSTDVMPGGKDTLNASLGIRN